MTRDQVTRWIADRLGDTSALTVDGPLLLVDPSSQTLELLSADSSESLQYPISTARNGLGNQMDSLRTPVGVHQIVEKIGSGEPPGMIFRGRQPVGEIATDMDNRGEDQITSRILWLSGLEPGFNQGGSQDTHERYIYIHGTSDEQRIGEPVSAGCVRMRNNDVIDLFERVETGTVVLILDE